ncbi:MAG: hypothetical protein FWD32_00205 [Firmicutes bacterium]|nr:hypothetical protein [Bacillota bacterium]
MVETKREYGFLQADAFGVENAREQLFGRRMSGESSQRFSNNHDNTEFNNIVRSNYNRGSVAVDDTEETSDNTFNTLDVQLSKYAEPEFAPYVSVNNTYTSPLANANTMEKENQTVEKQPIYNPYDNPYYQPKADIKWELEVDADKIVGVVKDTGVKQTVEFSNQQVTFTLNSRGALMTVAFAIITLLLTTFLIINTAAIGASQSNIKAYKAEIATLATSIANLETERGIAMNNAALEAKATDAGFTNDVGLITTVTVTRPPVTQTGNPDYSTNWFNEVVKFISGMFN